MLIFSAEGAINLAAEGGQKFLKKQGTFLLSPCIPHENALQYKLG